MSIEVTRTATCYQTAHPDRKIVDLIEEEDGRVKLQIYLSDAANKPIQAGWCRLRREEWLDLFVALYPDAVAYQFKDEDV